MAGMMWHAFRWVRAGWHAHQGHAHVRMRAPPHTHVSMRQPPLRGIYLLPSSGRITLAAHVGPRPLTPRPALRYVYERLTPPGGKPTFFTLVATQLVSGLWHGLYPGGRGKEG